MDKIDEILDSCTFDKADTGFKYVPIEVARARFKKQLTEMFFAMEAAQDILTEENLQCGLIDNILGRNK